MSSKAIPLNLFFRAARKIRRILNPPAPQLFSDYVVNPVPRYQSEPHPRLNDIVSQNQSTFKYNLRHILDYKEDLLKIEDKTEPNSPDPCWTNGYFSGMDTAALYGFLRRHNPKRYVEIGSGYSTKVARRAIKDGNLQTTITSIDPHPRSVVDTLCDRVIRKPLEEADLSFVDELEPGDILFFDGSHRCLMNSDATVFFLEVLPRVKRGVLIQVHDIFLPTDYPHHWITRYYSEQYLLACYLLTGRTILPVLGNKFVEMTPDLHKTLNPLFDDPRYKSDYRGGVSFWFEANFPKLARLA